MRKQVLLTAIAAVAAMAIGASSAQAAAVDGATGQPCPALVVSGNDVSGGCLVEDMTGSMILVGAGYCPVTFDIRIEADTDFYAVDPVADCNYPWTSRQACTDDANPTEVRPWLGTRSPRGLHICLEFNGYDYGSSTPLTLQPTLFPTGELAELTQTNNDNPVFRDGYWYNGGDTYEEIRFQ